MNKEIAVHLSIYIKANDQVTTKEAEELVKEYLDERNVPDYQLYDIEIREVD